MLKSLKFNACKNSNIFRFPKNILKKIKFRDFRSKTEAILILKLEYSTETNSKKCIKTFVGNWRQNFHYSYKYIVKKFLSRNLWEEKLAGNLNIITIYEESVFTKILISCQNSNFLPIFLTLFPFQNFLCVCTLISSFQSTSCVSWFVVALLILVLVL